MHTEMALWNTLGDILEGSGWTTAITEADVASSGMADSYMKAAHLTRTRHAHQVTLLTLHNLQQEALLVNFRGKCLEMAKTQPNVVLFW